MHKYFETIKANPGFSRQQDGSKPLAMDENVELSESALKRLQQRQCASDSGTADAGPQQDQQLVAVIVTAQLPTKCERSHHRNQSDCKLISNYPIVNPLRVSLIDSASISGPIWCKAPLYINSPSGVMCAISTSSRPI